MVINHLRFAWDDPPSRIQHTADGSEILHQLRLAVYHSLSHYLQGFIHSRWGRISSIDSILGGGFNYFF